MFSFGHHWPEGERGDNRSPVGRKVPVRYQTESATSARSADDTCASLLRITVSTNTGLTQNPRRMSQLYGVSSRCRGFELVWGGGRNRTALRSPGFDLWARAGFLLMACLLATQAPQNRESIHTSFEHCLYVSLRQPVKVENQACAEPESEQTRPNISDGETQGH